MIKVTYKAHMGDDLMVVDAARVSFAKKSKWVWPDGGPAHLSLADVKLINYLAAHGHFSPFAQPVIQLHVKAPIFVARQAFKSVVGFSPPNEISRRYVDYEPEFYRPEVWRSRPIGGAKQGSSGPIRAALQADATALMDCAYDEAIMAYDALLKLGVAPEQARMVLPQAMMTEWFWSGSLAAWARFCGLRLGETAQAETGEIAKQVSEIIAPRFPVSWAALRG